MNEVNLDKKEQFPVDCWVVPMMLFLSFHGNENVWLGMLGKATPIYACVPVCKSKSDDWRVSCWTLVGCGSWLCMVFVSNTSFNKKNYRK
jgi:hypothetical protein